MKIFSCTIPIKTVSEINSQEHYHVKNRRHKRQQFFTRAVLTRDNPKVEMPCKIQLTRMSPRFLDCDNLPSALKYIRDEIGAFLFPEKVTYYKRRGKIIANRGHADSDPRVTWVYAQEKAKTQGVRIQICFEEKV